MSRHAAHPARPGLQGDGRRRGRRLVRQRIWLENQRLADLRERFANDEFDLDRLGLHVEQVLRGEQPEWGGLPFTADPALVDYGPDGGMGFVTAAHPDGTTCACERCTAWVEADEWTFPYCPSCYANAAGKCA